MNNNSIVYTKDQVLQKLNNSIDQEIQMHKWLLEGVIDEDWFNRETVEYNVMFRLKALQLSSEEGLRWGDYMRIGSLIKK